MGPVPGATVSAGGQSAATDASGVATLTLPAGPVSVTATKDGYEPATVRLDVVAGGELTVRVVLTLKAAAQDQGTVVASTRTRRRYRRSGRSCRSTRPRSDRREHDDAAGQHREIARRDGQPPRPDHITGARSRDRTYARPAGPVHAAALRRRASLLRSPGRARSGPDPADGSRPHRSHRGRRVGAVRRERDGRRSQPAVAPART